MDDQATAKRDAEIVRRTSVLHSGSPSKSDEISSFHLNRDCPWGR
jgi:hypothetical protein